jgi:hypothetical protein
MQYYCTRNQTFGVLWRCFEGQDAYARALTIESKGMFTNLQTVQTIKENSQRSLNVPHGAVPRP